MLHRTLRRSLRPFPAPSATKPCDKCICQCGRIVDSRHYGTQRRAPSTRRTVTKNPDLTQLRIRKSKEVGRGSWQYQLLSDSLRPGRLTTSFETAALFLGDFDDAIQTLARGRPIEPTVFNALMAKHAITEADVFLLARLLSTKREPDLKFRSLKLLLSLSRAGHVDATVHVLGGAFAQLSRKARVLDSLELQYARAHLSSVTRQADCSNIRALTLEGKIVDHLGREEDALLLLARAELAAIQAVIRNQNFEHDFSADDDPASQHDIQGKRSDPLELSSPWVERFQIHFRRMNRGLPEYADAEKSARLGCSVDDPVAHYMYSQLVRKEDGNGHVEATSDWLYHVSKAAASDHTIAAHELAEWYIYGGWKYIIDEPPDHIKPTPFDSYPGPAQTWKFWKDVCVFLGLRTPQRLIKGESIFHSAHLPTTAKERWSLGMKWLERSTAVGYAPSHLFAAQIYLEKTLWAQASAPREALALSDRRYLVASKQQWEQLSDDERGELEQAMYARLYSGAKDPRNPFYDEERAKHELAMIFHAGKAKELTRARRAEYVRAVTSGRAKKFISDYGDEEDIGNMQYYRRESVNVRRYFRYPEVWASCEDQVEDLVEKAKAICDEHGWDIHDEDNKALLYKARMSGGRGVVVGPVPARSST